MKNKKSKILLIIIAVLVIAVVVFAVLNNGSLKEKQDSQANATVTIKAGDKQETFDLVYLKSFEKTVFTATQDTSKTDSEKKEFSGVPLITVLKDKGFDISGAKQIVFKAADGYTAAVTADEAKDSENIYLTYEREGKPSGIKQNGGSGPIEIVVAKDQFSQRWCKFLMEIEIQ